MNISLILLTILLAGLLGGFVNAIRTELPKNKYWQSLVKGVVAASLTPIFLDVIKSDIGKNLASNCYDYLIFGGLCLILAIFSDKFIDTLGEKLLKKVEKAEASARSANETVDTLVDKESEPEEDTVEISSKIKSFSEFANEEQNTQVNQILEALGDSKYKYRTLSGIANSTNISSVTVLKILQNLKTNGVVSKITTSKRELWTLRN